MCALNAFYRTMGVMKKMVIAGGIFLGFPPSNPPALLPGTILSMRERPGCMRQVFIILPGTPVS